MDKRLSDVLCGREDNYLLPFYWQHGDHCERISEQIKRIYDSGCRALCVESRPHPDFGGETWWRDMDIILSECEKLGMKVWLLDDKHFPTGYANGLITKKYPDLRKWMLVERHIDVIGPMDKASILAAPGSDEEPLVGVFAYQRTGVDQDMTGKAVDLSDKVSNGFLYWDIPKGCYRIFFLYKSRRGGRAEYIDMISEESVRVLIEAVYEPHFERYSRYFGHTFAGFFSDEPEFGNEHASPHRYDLGFYEKYIGKDGLALPYNEKLLDMMTKELGEDAKPYLGELWYHSEHSHLTRLAYMNAATRLYRDSFTRQIGDWCRSHNVEYIGHVIEDMNAHARLGHGTGYYFRALDGQDMSGIDIVLHQVMPGMAHYMNTASASSGVVDSEFFHYILAKLASSAAAFDPRMNGRAMCEVFGAYGWGEGTRLMKWLIEFLLVRGVNHFVPHAFSPDYPDPDCPPHFGAEGHDPQYDGFSAIMRYTNKASHLLSGARHIADAAVLYHAEGEWMSRYPRAMLTQKPARALYDSHIDFDVVCTDHLLEIAEIKDGRLMISGHLYGALVIPYAEYLPKYLTDLLSSFEEKGLAILYVDDLPHGVRGKVVKLDSLAETVRSITGCDIALEGDFPLLRIYHARRENTDVYMLFNESADTEVHTDMRLDSKGSFARLRLLEDSVHGDHSDNGTVRVDLVPGQSEILVFDNDINLPEKPVYDGGEVINPVFDIEIADSDDLCLFRKYKTTCNLVNIAGADEIPGFSGKMRYTFRINCKDPGKGMRIDLGKVGQSAKMWINGRYIGIRVCEPYCFDTGSSLVEGENEIVVEAANTLAGKVRDWFSYHLQLEPSGLLGPITVYRLKNDI